MTKIVTYVADVGSIKKKRFGWARVKLPQIKFPMEFVLLNSQIAS